MNHIALRANRFRNNIFCMVCCWPISLSRNAARYAASIISRSRQRPSNTVAFFAGYERPVLAGGAFAGVVLDGALLMQREFPVVAPPRVHAGDERPVLGLFSTP